MNYYKIYFDKDKKNYIHCESDFRFTLTDGRTIPAYNLGISDDLIGFPEIKDIESDYISDKENLQVCLEIIKAYKWTCIFSVLVNLTITGILIWRYL